MGWGSITQQGDTTQTSHTLPHTTNPPTFQSFYSLCIATMKTTTIQGQVFTLKKFDPVYNGKTDIFELYEHPSKEKKDAFKKWEGKLSRIYGLIGGKQNYSIFGEIIDEQGKRHAVKITKSNAFILPNS